MKERYLVLFEGEVQTGEAVRDVQKKLMEEFSISEDRLERLFSGQRKVVFKSDIRQKSEAFEKRFRATGAVCRLEVEYPEGYQPADCASCETTQHTTQEEGLAQAPVDTPWQEIRSDESPTSETDTATKDETPTMLDLWQAFAGPRGTWYGNHFARFSKEGGSRFIPTWNWPAFLFGVIWLIYRKMYAFAILSFLVSALFSVVPYGVFILAIVFGVTANFLYFLHVRLKVRAIIDASDKIDPQQAMDTFGGVNSIAKVVLIFLIFLTILAFAGAQFISVNTLTPKP